MRAANYVEETTTSIAGTSGDGAVTMTAIASTPRFSTVLGTQATIVRYVIEDTVGKRFESGIGSVAANVLTRTRPQVTWDGTTYSDNAPAALQFGSAPASGNIRIRMSATAESQGPTMAGRNATIAGDTSWRDYPISANMTWTSNGAGGGISADLQVYACYLLNTAGRLTGVQIDVATAVASSFMKLALYPCNNAGLPGSKILDFNNLDTGTTGIKTDTATGTWSPAGPVFLTPGWYYVGMIPSAGIAIRGVQGNTPIHSSPLGRRGGYGYSNTCTVAGSYATGLPQNPSPTTMVDPGGSALGAPWVGLRVQA